MSGATAWRTLRPSATTSGPMPSPGTTARRMRPEVSGRPAGTLHPDVPDGPPRRTRGGRPGDAAGRAAALTAPGSSARGEVRRLRLAGSDALGDVGQQL